MQIDTINCIYFVIQKIACEKMGGLDVEEIMSAIKIIILNIKVSTEKTKMALVFKINDNSIYIAIILIN